MQPGRAALDLLPVGPADAAECSIPLVREPIGESAAAGLAQVFKALGDPVRLRLLSLIGAHQGGEVCVCDLTTAFDLTQPTISHHLKVLREAGVLRVTPQGSYRTHELRREEMEHRFPGVLDSITRAIGEP